MKAQYRSKAKDMEDTVNKLEKKSKHILLTRIISFILWILFSLSIKNCSYAN